MGFRTAGSFQLWLEAVRTVRGSPLCEDPRFAFPGGAPNLPNLPPARRPGAPLKRVEMPTPIAGCRAGGMVQLAEFVEHPTLAVSD